MADTNTMSIPERQRSLPRRERWLALVFVLALAVRIAWVLLAPSWDPFLRADPLHGDAGSYDRIARNLASGYGFGSGPGAPTAFWPPLYPVFLAGLYRVFGYNLQAVRLVQAFLGTLTVVAVALAARDALGRRVGLLVGLGMALYPHMIYFGTWLIAEALYLWLLSLILLLAARLLRRSFQWGFALLGLLLGLAVLAKPIALMLLPAVLIWAWVGPRHQHAKDRVVGCILVLAMAACVIAPWTARNLRLFGDFVLVSNNGGYTFYGANNAEAFGGHREGFPTRPPGLTEAQADREFYRLGLEWIARHPADFAALVGRKLSRLLSPLSVASYEHDYPLPLSPVVRTMYGAFLGAAVAGAVLALRRWRAVLLYYVLVLQVIIGAMVFYGDARYTLPMVPALVVFASLALVTARDRWRGCPDTAERGHGPSRGGNI